MNFHFNEEEQEILGMLHDFCLKEVAPIAAEIDEEERFPEETWHKLAEMGMMGVPFPEEYGGAGLSYLTYIGVCEELARHCATTSVMVSAHTSLCCWPILRVRHRGAEAEVPAPPGHRREAGRLRPHRARRGHRRGHAEDHRRGQGRPLGAQRLQDLHHQRRLRRHLRGVRHDRQGEL